MKCFFFTDNLTFFFQMSAEVSIGEPFKSCSALTNAEELKHRIAVIERGECMFIDKVLRKKVLTDYLSKGVMVSLRWFFPLLNKGMGVCMINCCFVLTDSPCSSCRCGWCHHYR